MKPRHLLSWLFTMTVACGAAAEVNIATQSATRPLGLFLGAGAGVLLEKENDGRGNESRLPAMFSLTARSEGDRRGYGARLEYSRYDATDGNQTISLRREREQLATWLSREFLQSSPWRPYVSVGFGFARTGVEYRAKSSVGDAREQTQGDWKAMAGVGAGLVAHWSQSFLVGSEVRWETGEVFRLDDARMSLVFNAELRVF